MTARFPVGTAVQVREAFPPGHVRTPFFIRGKRGVVDSVAGTFPNPEELAYGRPGLPPQPLYRVRFRQADLWPNYRGARNDTAVVDIFEHWLDRSEQAAEKRR